MISWDIMKIQVCIYIYILIHNYIYTYLSVTVHDCMYTYWIHEAGEVWDIVRKYIKWIETMECDGWKERPWSSTPGTLCERKHADWDPSRSLVLLVNLLVLVPKLQRLRFWLEAEAWKGVKQCYWDGNLEVLETWCQNRVSWWQYTTKKKTWIFLVHKNIAT